jgi:hypothetical protein
MKALESQYHQALQWGGGDFTKVKPTNDRHVIRRLLRGYKSPLTADTYSAFINSLADGIVGGGKVPGGTNDDPLVKARIDLDEFMSKATDDKHRKWLQDWYNKEYTGIGKVQKMMCTINDSGWKATMTGQEAVDQFSAFVKDTQSELVKKHPGKNTITVYRGVQGDYANELKRALKKSGSAEIAVRRIDSWSASEQVARKFAGRTGVVITKQVPIKEIAFSYEGPRGSGLDVGDYMFGGDDEQEHLWMHQEKTMTVQREEVK